MYDWFTICKRWYSFDYVPLCSVWNGFIGGDPSWKAILEVRLIIQFNNFGIEVHIKSKFYVSDTLELIFYQG